MRYIPKTMANEPRSLCEHRLRVHADYDNYAEKDELRQSLLEEQGHICCYCMGRITLSDMRIEHWQPQSRYPQLQLDYKNLLGACMGNERSPVHLHHCDVSKKDSDITINPTTPQCERLVGCRISGEMYSTDSDIQQDLEEVLRLNQEHLKSNRKEVLFAFVEVMRMKYPGKPWEKSMLQQIWSKFHKDDFKLKPYCQVILLFFRNRFE